MAFRGPGDTDLPTDDERAELISAPALAARITEERVGLVVLYPEQGLRLAWGDDAPVGVLRVGSGRSASEALMGTTVVSAWALGGRGRGHGAGRRHQRTVDRTDSRPCSPGSARQPATRGSRSGGLSAGVAAWTSEPDLALLRAMYVLAWVHYRQADHPAALAAFERTAAEARRAGLEWSADGLDARAMAVTTAYEMGEWDHALEVADHTADVAIPTWAAASIDASSGLVLAGRGLASSAELLSSTRSWWAEEGRMAVQSGVAALDVLGRDGEVERMLDLHTQLVTFLRGLWGEGRVAAEVRLAAVVIGHLATALRTGASARRTELLADADRSAPRPRSSSARARCSIPPSIEGRAWAARVDAEHERARWAAGDDVAVEGLVARWRDVVDLFAEHGDPYETARSRWRLAEVLLAAGDREAPEVRRRPLTPPARWAQCPSSRPSTGSPRAARAPRRTSPSARPRCSRRVAEGRSSGEIGRALFISTRTASVHVSNILAKLGAASRGEAEAVARTAGLLDDGDAQPADTDPFTGSVAAVRVRSARMRGRLTTAGCTELWATTSASGRSVKDCT